MKRSSCIVLRPVSVLIALMLGVLSLSGLLIPLWIIRVTKIENEVKVDSKITNQELNSGIRKTAALFFPINASSINLVRVLTSSLDEHDLQFSKIESKVASTLFQALSTIPYLSQISYIGLDGLFFAYYTERNQTYAMYSNSTFSDTKYSNYSWYIQPVNRDSGKIYGEAVISPPFSVINSTYFQEALRNKNGYASVGTSWRNTRNILLLCTVGMYGKGAISLGFSMQSLVDFLISEIRFYDGSFYLSTMDGNVLAQGIPNTHMILAGDQVSFQLLNKDDNRVAEVGNITCQSGSDSTSRNYVLSIGDKEYVINCSPLEIAGLPLVYALAMPNKGLSSLVHKNVKLAFILLMLMIGVVVITICTFVYLMVEAAKREMHLCGALISQMEATQQSERKSMNKSLAFANASHDIRASLAGISGLIEICRNEASKRGSFGNIPSNLLQMESCTRDLLGILNSILDTSKIEAGKMQLEEEEFDLEQLMEDVVDLYHPVGSKKGVDVILDPYDGSITKFSRVKGDRGKLKQVLTNLLSNAVKFTSEGHIVLRGWARKPSLENEILSSNRNNSMRCLLGLFKIKAEYSESENVNNSISQRDANCMEFVFEVNDTGKGIPKEKQKSVFENYVQVKETALGQEGTGLGLGIVQSLVRLMGGEIGIVDKEVDERGTCFKFNVFFSTFETNNSPNANIESISDSFRHTGPNIRSHSPKNEGSQVLLFINSPKRSNLMQDFMHRVGIKVQVVMQYEQLSPSLKRIKQKLNLSNYRSSSGKSNSSARSKEVPLSSLDGRDNFRGVFSSFVLIVIDTRAGPFREISRAVAEFRRDLSETCCSRVVWLDKPDANSSNSFRGLDEDKLPMSDLVISKPFHGSRLYRVIGLLPEFGGALPPRRGEVSDSVRNSDGASKSGVKGELLGSKCEIEEVGGANGKKPLVGKKILVADDDPIGRRIATFVGSQLGANIFSCENGEEALKLVCKSLEDGMNVGASKNLLPFDCILMDCEMPVMNGVEATARIRKAEESYGIHIPVMALTAHNKGQEIDSMIQAGVDGYLTKPLNKDIFLKTVSEFISRV